MKNRIVALITAILLAISIAVPVMANDAEGNSINEIYVIYDENDATENIKKAFLEARMTTGRDRVILKNPGKGKVWTSGPFWIGSNVEFYIEPNTVLEAKSGAFPYYKQSFINIEDESNVNIIGGDSETSIIRMKIEEYPDGEWRHSINANGVTNMIIRNLTLDKSGGDGIVLSDVDLLTSLPTGPNKNVIIENCIINGHAKNGIAIISGIDIIVNNCKLTNTGQYNPEGLASAGPHAGIDVETEARKVVDNITIANCLIENSRRNGITCNVGKQPSTQYRLNIFNCELKNLKTGFNMLHKRPKVEGVINIENCIVNTTSYNGITFREWGTNGHTSIKNSMFINAYGDSTSAIFNVVGNPKLENSVAEYDLGNISFDNVYNVKSMDSETVDYTGGTEEFKIKDITGAIYTDRADAKIVHNTEHLENVDLKLLPMEKSALEIYNEIKANEDYYQQKAADIVAEIEADIETDIERKKNAIEEITVKIDGAVVDFEEQPPIIVNDRTLVPLRKIFETMGAEVNWNDKTRTVTATKGGTTICLSIDNPIATKNDKQILLDVSPQIKNGRTLVPLRFVSEALGGIVTWEGDRRTAFIINRGEIKPQIVNGNEIIIDCNTEGYKENGMGWATSASVKNHDGTGVRTSTYGVLGTEFTPSIDYIPEITEEGNYDIYVYKIKYGNSDSATGFDIVYDTDKLLDPEPPVQNWHEGETGWVKLTDASGPLHFTPQSHSGTQYVRVKKTRVSDYGVRDYIRGSAVKFVKVN